MVSAPDRGPVICGYISCSADGYVADASGGVGFLDPFQDAEYGFQDFFDSIDAVLMGRATYDQVRGFDVPWPYADKIAHVVTSRPLQDPPEGVERWEGGFEDYARAMHDATSWLVGGPQLQADFIDLGLLNRLDLFIVPVLLGQGVPLHPGAYSVPMMLEGAEPLDRGLVRLTYTFPMARRDV